MIPCPACAGTGLLSGAPWCPTCDGAGRIADRRRFDALRAARRLVLLVVFLLALAAFLEWLPVRSALGLVP